MNPETSNTNCSCNKSNEEVKKNAVSLALSWLGFHNKCKYCGRISSKEWNSKAILLLISAIVGIQFLVSLIIYPLISKIFISEMLQMIYFISIHVLLIPFYLKFTFTFLLASDQ